MQRLLQWSFTVFASIAVIITVIIRTSRDSGRLLDVLATNPDGTNCERFCLFGAQPEKMGYSQIETLLAHHPLLRGLHVESRNYTYDHFFGQNVDVDHVDGLVSVLFHEPSHCIEEYHECYAVPNNLLLKSLRSALPLAIIIKDFGIPDFVELSTGSLSGPLISLYYRGPHLGFTYQLAQEGVISAEDTIASIDLFSVAEFNDFTLEQPHYAWPGFGHIASTGSRPD